MSMSLRSLRAEAPEWSWAAERYGMGWRYVGRRGDEHVEVYAVAVMCGPGEDDFETQWRVYDGRTGQSYAAWWCAQAEADAASKEVGRG